MDRRISACNASKREGKEEGHREGYREGQDSGRAELEAAVAEATAVAEARVTDATAAAAALEAELVVQRSRLEAALSGRGNFVEQGTQSEWCVYLLQFTGAKRLGLRRPHNGGHRLSHRHEFRSLRHRDKYHRPCHHHSYCVERHVDSFRFRWRRRCGQLQPCNTRPDLAPSGVVQLLPQDGAE